MATETANGVLSVMGRAYATFNEKDMNYHNAKRNKNETDVVNNGKP